VLFIILVLSNSSKCLFKLGVKPDFQQNATITPCHQRHSQALTVATGDLGDGSLQRGPGAAAEPRWGLGSKPPERNQIYTNNLQLSNIFLRRFVDESVLHLPLPLSPNLLESHDPTRPGQGCRVGTYAIEWMNTYIYITSSKQSDIECTWKSDLKKYDLSRLSNKSTVTVAVVIRVGFTSAQDSRLVYQELLVCSARPICH